MLQNDPLVTFTGNLQLRVTEGLSQAMLSVNWEVDAMYCTKVMSVHMLLQL